MHEVRSDDSTARARSRRRARARLPESAAVPAGASPGEARRWARVALAGLAAFVLAALLLHARRDDLDWIDAQMSRYLIGAWGPLLQAAYVALSTGMVALAFGLRRALAPAARSAAPLLLFVPGGIALSTTAYAWMDLPGVDGSLEGFVHGITAQAAFLLAPSAMVVQALGLRRDPGWRAAARWLLPWALACFAAVWVLALWPGLPRGLAQKAVIALLVGWLAAAALLLAAWARRRVHAVRRR